MTQLPDFELEDLSEFPISTLCTDGEINEEQAFIIALAVAFNDMKDYAWFYYQIEKHPPSEPQEISTYSGQWTGMKEFCLRKSVATLFETLELLSKNKGVLENESFKNVISVMDSNSSQDWKALINLAQNKTSEQKVYKMILKIRNNITSHYYGTNNFKKGLKSYQVFPRKLA